MAGLYQQSLIETLRLAVVGLLGQWQLSGATRLSLLCISENATFRADDPAREQALVIRVHRPGYHSVNEIRSELAWITALRERPVLHTPRPVPTRSGKLIAEFDRDGATHQVVAFEFVSGRQPDESGDLSAGFEQLGRLTANLHRHAREWSRPAGFERKTWNFDTTIGARPHWGDWRDAPGLSAAAAKLLQRCVDRLRDELEAFGDSADRFGLIHADLRLANLLVAGERLTVIDFDDCGFGWYLYDFAAAISFIETSPQIPALQQAWVTGYRSVSPLSQDEENALPMFIMLRRILLTAWIGSHPETPTAVDLGSAYTEATVALGEAYLSRNQGVTPAS